MRVVEVRGEGAGWGCVRGAHGGGAWGGTVHIELGEAAGRLRDGRQAQVWWQERGWCARHSQGCSSALLLVLSSVNRPSSSATAAQWPCPACGQKEIANGGTPLLYGAACSPIS